ncbi:hypothetical protein FRC10_001381 [Ceratobasidium sp. 414]|nr:hypothetical protein FRC10_001381 [Ceratobasidium sp. 414]
MGARTLTPAPVASWVVSHPDGGRRMWNIWAFSEEWNALFGDDAARVPGSTAVGGRHGDGDGEHLVKGTARGLDVDPGTLVERFRGEKEVYSELNPRLGNETAFVVKL